MTKFHIRFLYKSTKLSFFAISIFIALSIFLSDVAIAQSFSLDLGQGGSTATERLIQLFLLVTVMALAPSILVMTTSAPTFEKAWEDGVRPYIDGQIDEREAFEKSLEPLEIFMRKFVRDQDLRLFLDIANIPELESREDIPIKVLIPAFIISELRRAFEIGFLVFIPFLVIDMVVASVLMSMGMMMLPPIIIALPFKIIFFVLVDGWFLIVGSLVQSFGGLNN